MIQTSKERLQKQDKRQQFSDSMSIRQDFELTFGTPHGKRTLEYLMERGHLLESTCTGNAWSHFYEGERNFVLKTIGSMIPGLLGAVFAEVMSQRQYEVDTARARIIDGEERT